MALQVNEEVLASILAKSTSDNPTTALIRPQWQSVVSNPLFGDARNFWVALLDGSVAYEAFIRYETPGEVNIVVRKQDGAIAFVNKYRVNVLPKTPENKAWRNDGNLDILTAPHLGMDMLEVTRGWVFDPNKPWKVMTEGQEETGLIVEEVVSLPHFYANTGIDASWIDMSFGFATDQPYEGSADSLEKVEIKKVVWLTPPKVRRYMLEGTCALSKAALGTFRAYALASDDDFLKQLGQQL